MKKSRRTATVPLAWSEYVSALYRHLPTGVGQLKFQEKEQLAYFRMHTMSAPVNRPS